MTTKSKVLHVKTLLALIAEYDLETPVGFNDLTLDYISSNYNGAGPDWLPASKRKILTWLLGIFEPAFLVHDMEFSASNRTRAGFIRANKRLYKNCKIIISKLYPMANPLLWFQRSIWLVKAWMTYRACVRFGFSAWQN